MFEQIAKMIKPYYSKSYMRFIVGLIIAFGLFYLFYDYVKKYESVSRFYNEGVFAFTTFLAESTRFLLDVFGYEAVTYGKTVRIIDHFSTSGIYIDRGCMGRNVMLAFAGFVLVFPGKFVHKLWYIPMGLGILIIVNVLRIFGLALIADCCPKYSDINHYVVFKIAAWIVIFILWAIWINKFGLIKKSLT